MRTALLIIFSLVLTFIYSPFVLGIVKTFIFPNTEGKAVIIVAIIACLLLLIWFNLVVFGVIQ